MAIIDFLAGNTRTDRILQAAQESMSLEEFLEACFSGSGHDICITPPSIEALVPHLCRLVQGKEITDHSYYDGYVYDPGKTPSKNASLILNGDRLFLNDHDLQCAIDDPSLESLRIQLHSSQYRDGDKVRVAVPEAALYFDFWDKEKGFSKKCTILCFRLGRKKVAGLEAELGRQNEEEALNRVRELSAKQTSPTKVVSPDPTQLGLL